jgi:hypothetical protein
MLPAMNTSSPKLNVSARRVPYHTVRRHLQTGDLVLFAGTSWSSRLVQCLTLSRWSHVGVIVRLPEHGDRPLLWELTRASKLADIHHGVLVDGVQLVSLDDKLDSYQGDVAIRRLRSVIAEPQRLQSLRELLERWQARPYRNILWKHLHAWRRGEETDAIAGHGGFCSEFVAEIYKRWHLLPPGRPSRRYLPQDFAPGSSLKLLHGALSPAWMLAL